MAEISSLLGLITDDNTRQALIAQMENMFDNAPDEERLIQEIGNPTKVAVALIRYADSGKITPAAAPVVAPEQVQPKRAPQPRPRAEQYRPLIVAWRDGAPGRILGKYVRDTVYLKYLKLKYLNTGKPETT